MIDELEKLARLHESGALSDEEFARAKDAALRKTEAGSGARTDPMNDPTLGNAAQRYVNFQIGMSIVGLIVVVVLLVLVVLPRFGAIPSP